MVDSENPPLPKPAKPIRRSALDIWLCVVTAWYLTGLLAAFGFSFGLNLLRPASGISPEKLDRLAEFTWQDGKWYKQIATEGYHYDSTGRSNVAFFPVYPLLARAVMIIAGVRAEIALLIVSNLCLLAALAILAFYVRDRWPEDPSELANYTVLAAALFPTACFFRLAYSESTFLLLAVLAMYAILRCWPFWATALIVGLATAARPVGISLLAPFAIYIWQRTRGKGAVWPSGELQVETEASTSMWAGRPQASAPNNMGERSVRLQIRPPQGRETSASRFPFSGRLRSGSVVARLALYVPLACWGIGAFAAYQCYAFGDAFAVLKAHDHWRIQPRLPWPQKLAALITLEPIRSVYDPNSPAFWAARDTHCVPWFSLQFANPVYLIVALLMLVAGAKKQWLSPEETSLATLMLLIPYVTRAYDMGMGSMGRFVCVTFVLYFVVARVALRFAGTLPIVLFTSSAILMTVYMGLYAAGYLIF